jgi:hypothetical protein
MQMNTGNNPKKEIGADHMSRREAIDILARLAQEIRRTPDEITALEMASRRLLTRNYQQLRNKARRRLAASTEGGAK